MQRMPLMEVFRKPLDLSDDTEQLGLVWSAAESQSDNMRLLALDFIVYDSNIQK
tara:strand:+ start:5467 stop:5628 length:162 start_codon:yes stop_codon:yes gene_type:complete